MSLASGPGPGWLLFSFGMGLVSGSKCPSQCQCLVQEVTCTGMRLTEYPPDIPLNTRRLYLNDNAIMVLPAMELGLLSDLVYLDCHDNLIGELMDYTFVGVSKLIYLDLSSNNLTSISPYGFSVLGNLVHLNISNNPHLSSLNRYTFANTSSLRYLDLRNTGLQTLDHAAFQGLLTLHTLYLSGNPWRCNCSFLDFTIYLIVTHLNHPVAKGPRDLEGNSVPRGQEKSQQGDAWKGRSLGAVGSSSEKPSSVSALKTLPLPESAEPLCGPERPSRKGGAARCGRPRPEGASRREHRPAASGSSWAEVGGQEARVPAGTGTCPSSVLPERRSERHVRGAHGAGRLAHRAGGQPAALHVHHAPGPAGLPVPAAHRLLHLLGGHRGRLAHGHVRCDLPAHAPQVERDGGRGRAWAAGAGGQADLQEQGRLGPRRLPAAHLAAGGRLQALPGRRLPSHPSSHLPSHLPSPHSQSCRAC
uniref:Leucine rich repeat containing 52 n=1 Tax=Rousettus aegyptiacus TaxID=9407 RepID=A0A7J8BFP8_ROUAE|nr:leucine rich repeat containing 52 [Rousettus aegyptiacus]